MGVTNHLVLAVNTNNGLVTVTFQPTGSKTNTAHGAVLQNQTNALGAFPGANQTGSLSCIKDLDGSWTTRRFSAESRRDKRRCRSAAIAIPWLEWYLNANGREPVPT